MKHDFSPTMLRRQIKQLSDLDLVRTRYCYQIGSTFLACALLEDSVINAMLICDRVRVENALREDAHGWEQILAKQKHLQASTLGSLISLLAKHGISSADLIYLRWLKSKRDFFIHRYFQKGPWPGDLDESQIDHVCRTLGALEILFHRGSGRMVHILARAGLMEIHDLSEGCLVFNLNMLDRISE